MIRTFAVTCSSVLLLASLPAQFDRTEPPALQHFWFESRDFDTEHSRTGQAGYYALLPKAHDHADNKDRQYPWILWLPGFGGPADFVTRGGAATLDRLRGDGKIPELAVIVFRPPGRRTTYMNGEDTGDVEDLICQDLIAEVQKRFRLGGERRHRAVMGVSAGGFGALKIALRHPQLFGAVAAHSSAILPADPNELGGMAETTVMRLLRGGIKEELGDPIDKDKWMMQMPMGLVQKKTPADLAGLQIYFDAGTDDHYGFFEPNQKLAATMRQHGHRFAFRPVEEGGHAWSSDKMVANLEHSLWFVGKALSGEDAVAAMQPKGDDGHGK